MKKLFFLFLLGIPFIACNENNIPNSDYVLVPTELAKNYISRFVDCEVIKVISDTQVTTSFFYNGMPYISIKAFPEKDTVNLSDYWNGYYFDSSTRGGSCDDAGRSWDDEYYLEKRRIYYDYINQIGDTCFNRVLSGGVTMNEAITVPLRSISITCDKNFSSDFPAGAELNSLFDVVFDDLYATIKNGYKTVEGSYTYPKDIPNWPYYVDHSFFEEKLSEVNFPNHPFIWNAWLCILDMYPDKTDEYTFHVKVTLVNGTEMEAMASPVTIKGRLD